MALPDVDGAIEIPDAVEGDADARIEAGGAVQVANGVSTDVAAQFEARCWWRRPRRQALRARFHDCRRDQHGC